MQLNLDSKNIAFEIIEEVLKELLDGNDANAIDPNILYGMRDEWAATFEYISNEDPLAAKNTEVEPQGSFDSFERQEEEYSDDIELKRAEENSVSYIVCLFVKVTRSKGKWKLVFKDGFINIDGSQDIPFNNASGELEW